MPSRADAFAPSARLLASPRVGLRTVGRALHALGVVSVGLMLWRLLTPAPVRPFATTVSANGALEASLATLVRARTDSIDVTIAGAPTPAVRATLRALRASGRHVEIRADHALPAVAMSLESEWRASGGTRLTVASDSAIAIVARDAAGLLDSIPLDTSGLQLRTGPVQSVVRVETPVLRALSSPLVASEPVVARVLIAGAASWESKFVTAALEEAGWPMDVAVSLAPRVTVGQGAARVPSRARHAIVIVLPGAPSSVTTALPAFVRQGGGVVLVGDAARLESVAMLRAGAPGSMVAGEPGAEASERPRHGLDVVPITSLVRSAVPLEWRDGRVTLAARRIGAGRVVQVGYENSWIWRMAGGDDAPAAHRRWWSALLSGIVPVSAPRLSVTVDAEHDTLDAAPLAALVRDLGRPITSRAAVRVQAPAFASALDLRWLLALALASFVGAWVIRRWRGYA
jgi:hypothetical protein